jgi:murein endopeptidase
VSRALALAFLLVASTARAELPPGDRVPTHEARRPSAHRRASNERSRRERARKPETDKVAELVSELEDDGADLALLVTLLRDDHDGRPIMARDSGSVGSAHAGALRAAVQLPDHGAYVVRDPSRACGTAETIRRLTSAFDEVVRADPSAPRVRVHDLSLQNGGPMHGHKSHQSGRDVDLTYYQRTCERECAGQPVSANELDAARQWRLLRHWLERGHAEFIFIDYALQRPLYQQAKSAGATARQLARWFQYPRGPAFPGGVIRHIPNHANHVHVRFRCAQGDVTCRGSATRRVPARGAMNGMSLLELVTDESENQALLDQFDD